MAGDKPVAWIRRAVQNASYRARKKGYLVDITPGEMEEQWQEQDGYCYWFHVPMGIDPDCPYHPLTPSLDRVVPDHGYTHGNVVWACLAANAAKRDTDPDLWEEFLDLLWTCFSKRLS